MKSKPKRNPERELYNRWIINVILYAVVAGVGIIVIGFAIAVLVKMLSYVVEYIAIIFEHEEFRDIQNYLKLFIALVVGSSSLVGIVSYGTYNEERINELEKIVESEESNHGV